LYFEIDQRKRRGNNSINVVTTCCHSSCSDFCFLSPFQTQVKLILQRASQLCILAEHNRIIFWRFTHPHAFGEAGDSLVNVGAYEIGDTVAGAGYAFAGWGGGVAVSEGRELHTMQGGFEGVWFGEEGVSLCGNGLGGERRRCVEGI
jgi:hypothetical protein